MAVTVTLRPMVAGAPEEKITINAATKWVTSQFGSLDLSSDTDQMVASFATGMWAYCEVAP